jgi:hypothetical protein
MDKSTVFTYTSAFSTPAAVDATSTTTTTTTTTTPTTRCYPPPRQGRSGWLFEGTLRHF